jgi:adenosine deaminase
MTSVLFDASSVPKVVLHEHLDGNLRPQTLLQLCQAMGIALPADTPQALQHWIHTQANSGSLERYVAAFGLTVAAMASPQACEQVAFEAVEDCAADGAVLIELRMAPLLLEAHGLAGGEAVEAMLAGLSRGSAATGVPSGLIVCGMRSNGPADVLRSAELAVRFAGQGLGARVVGFDLAGAERGFPATMHAKAVALAREAGLGLTLHAGEADVGERVMQAMDLHATRIGHGVQITQGEGAMARMCRARDVGVHFEVCPTSNLHTGACNDLATHPMISMERAGLNWSIQADNRLISVLTQGSECQVAHELCGLSWAQLLRGQMRAARASFLPLHDRLNAQAQIQAWCLRHVIAIE